MSAALILLDATGQPLAAGSADWAEIHDTRTGLIWGRTLAQRLIHAEAASAVAALNEKAQGWRLPTRAELLTLVDDTRYSPACNPAFSDMKSDWYWTASLVASNPDCACFVHFNYGDSHLFHRDNRCWVRPVRASQ